MKRSRCKHLSPEEINAIVEFARNRVTVNEFCERMKIHPSTYSSVLIRHGLRKGETRKDKLIREYLAEKSAAQTP